MAAEPPFTPPPYPPIITADGAAQYVNLPPRPMIPEQKIVNEDGTPTFEYHLWMTQQYEWERRLMATLTGILYPDKRPPTP